MKMYFKKTAAAVLACLTMTAVIPLTSQPAAAASPKVVVIGDSISSGKGLNDAEQCYTALTAKALGGTIVDLSKDDCTTVDLLTTLDDASVKAQLAQADVILFSVGMQDIMNPFEQELYRFKDETGLEITSLDQMFTLTMADLKDKNGNQITENTLIDESNKLVDVMRANRDEAKANILTIGEKLSAYTNAKVICTNTYNPLDRIEQYDQLAAKSEKRKTGYDSIMNPAGTIFKKHLNGSYSQIGEQYGFTVIDVYSKFEKLAYQYTGLNNLIYEPNAKGHRWIAEQAAAALGVELPKGFAPGDVDNSGDVDASDATYALKASVNYAMTGEYGLSEAAIAAADVNHDGQIDAEDATIMLIYSVNKASGVEDPIESYVPKK